MSKPFDAVLVVAFGGPQGPADVRPFLANVLRGRRVSPARIEDVAHHYDRFGGVSPLTMWTLRQAEGLQGRLAASGAALPVYVGMRNWQPYLADTLAQMSRDGVRRAVGFIAAAQRSYSSCTQYRENVAAARGSLSAAGLPDVEVIFVDDWHAAPGFVEANAACVGDALAQLPDGLGERARLIFTAHSIPESMAARYPYEAQLREGAAAVARRVRPDAPAFDLVYQSRSGRPEDPWLGPDISDHLRDQAAGLEAAVLSPIGFLCDHIEVLYDLDVEAMDTARELGIPVVRASAVNDSPAFLDMMAAVVMRTVRRYSGGRPLPIVPLPDADSRASSRAVN